MNGVLSWSGGAIGGTGATTLSGGGTFDTTNNYIFLDRTLFNASGSTVTLSGPNVFYSNTANANWTNQAGAVFTIAADASLLPNNAAGIFTNNSGATFQKSGGAGFSNFAWAFTTAHALLTGVAP